MTGRHAIILAATLVVHQSDPKLTVAIRMSGFADALDPSPASVSANGRYVALISEARLAAADGNDCVDVYIVDLQTEELSLASNRPGWTRPYQKILSPRISGDGRFVVFQAAVQDPSEPMPRWQIVLLDRTEDREHVISVDAAGRPANGHSTWPAISADGSTVVFQSRATNLAGVSELLPGSSRIYLFAVATGLLRRVSISSNGAPPGQNDRVMPSVSGDGRYVVFVQGPRSDIYLHDTATNQTACISRGAAGGEANGPSSWPTLSKDGRMVAFTSEASNLVKGDRNGRADVFLHDARTGMTELISRTRDGAAGNGDSRRPAISADGQIVAFQSLASNLICTAHCLPGERDINMLWDVFVFDRRRNAMVRASASGSEQWMEASYGAVIDDSGRVLLFLSFHPVDDFDKRHDLDAFVCK